MIHVNDNNLMDIPSRQKHLFLSSTNPLSIAFGSNLYLYASRSDLIVALSTRTYSEILIRMRKKREALNICFITVDFPFQVEYNRK